MPIIEHLYRNWKYCSLFVFIGKYRINAALSNGIRVLIMERQKHKRPKCKFSKVYALRDNGCLIFAFKLNFHIVHDTLIHCEVVG